MVFIFFLSGFGLIFEFSKIQIFKFSSFRIGISVRIHIVSNVVVVVSKDLRNKLDWTYHALKRVCLFVCFGVWGGSLDAWDLFVFWLFLCSSNFYSFIFYANLSLVLDYSFFLIHVYFFLGNLDKLQCFCFSIFLITWFCWIPRAHFFSLKGIYLNIPTSFKGQLISTGLFAILEFFPKNKPNNPVLVLLGKKTKFVRLVFGRIVGLRKTLLLCLTFLVIVFFCFTDL